jgi:hypothetical protein
LNSHLKKHALNPNADLNISKKDKEANDNNITNDQVLKYCSKLEGEEVQCEYETEGQKCEKKC